MTKRGRTLIAASTVTILTSLALSSPALAHDRRYDGPYACGPSSVQSCGYGQVRDNHQIIDACDTRADGYGYQVDYRLRSDPSGPNQPYRSVSDGNGSAAGCGIQRVGSASNPIKEWRVCSNQGLVHVVMPAPDQWIPA